ncbi:hypothetical protein VTK73DRAFT_5667 [Phialemonium thermophilum]|uniref:Uncharacterized protein n=1 Tax=Phialemonium thermophilum TaxID=223376 RepID=A0ABR3V1D8_9PEZI
MTGRRSKTRITSKACSLTRASVAMAPPGPAPMTATRLTGGMVLYGQTWVELGRTAVVSPNGWIEKQGRSASLVDASRGEKPKKREAEEERSGTRRPTDVDPRPLSLYQFLSRPAGQSGGGPMARAGPCRIRHGVFAHGEHARRMVWRAEAIPASTTQSHLSSPPHLRLSHAPPHPCGSCGGGKDGHFVGGVLLWWSLCSAVLTHPNPMWGRPGSMRARPIL